MTLNSEPTEENFLGNAVEIYLFIVGIIIIIFSFITCIVLVYSLRKYQSDSKWHIASYLTICGAIFYLISSILFISALTQFNENSDNNFEDDDYFVICIVLFVLFFIFSKLSVYIQLFLRLWATFKETVLSLNKLTISIYIILLCLLFITVIWWITLISFRYLSINRDFDGYFIQFYPVFIFLFITDCCLSWLVVGLFINKLFKSILFRCRSDFFQKTARKLTESEKSKSSNINTPNTPNTPNTNMTNTPSMDRSNCERQYSLSRDKSLMIDIAFASIDETDKKRLDIITRQFILSTLSIITTQLCYISIIIVLIIKNIKPNLKWDQNILYVVYGGILYPMDLIFNQIALYLNYGFAAKHYNIICKHCHQKCGLCVIRKASKKIVGRHSREISHIKMININNTKNIAK